MSRLIVPTMGRTVVTGPYGWDRERLPEDEVFLRRRWLQGKLEASDHDLLLVYGDAQACDMLSWATNFHPKLHWAIAIIDRTGESVLCVPGPVRDVPAARALSFDCVTEPIHRLAAAMKERLAATGTPAGARRVGVLAHDDWCLEADAALRDAAEAAGVSLEDVGRNAVWPPFGVRDRALLREARAIWSGSSKAFAEAWARGRSASEAINATELHARLAGAHDVRVLASRDSGLTLGPLEHGPHAACERGVAYIAVQYLGVWADGFHTVHDADSTLPTAAVALLDRLERSLHAGQHVEDGLDALYEPVLPLQPHPMLRRHCITWHGRRQRTTADGGAPANAAPFALHAGFVDGSGGVLLTRWIDPRPGRDLQ